MSDKVLTDYADAFAFMGNSLMDTMHHTGEAGLEPSFWAAFPDFDSNEVSAALDELFAFAQAAQERTEQGEDVATQVSVEFTRLFVGPPSPAAAPWESAYGAGDASVGFGDATFALQQVLRDAGLEKTGENNQYADHMGIELLVLSEMCRAMAAGKACGSFDSPDSVAAYMEKHPLRWIGSFCEAVGKAAPDGYYVRLLAVCKTLLESFKAFSE